MESSNFSQGKIACWSAQPVIRTYPPWVFGDVFQMFSNGILILETLKWTPGMVAYSYPWYQKMFVTEMSASNLRLPGYLVWKHRFRTILIDSNQFLGWAKAKRKKVSLSVLMVFKVPFWSQLNSFFNAADLFVNKTWSRSESLLNLSPTSHRRKRTWLEASAALERMDLETPKWWFSLGRGNLQRFQGKWEGWWNIIPIWPRWTGADCWKRWDEILDRLSNWTLFDDFGLVSSRTNEYYQCTCHASVLMCGGYKNFTIYKMGTQKNPVMNRVKWGPYK